MRTELLRKRKEDTHLRPKHTKGWILAWFARGEAIKKEGQIRKTVQSMAAYGTGGRSGY